MLSLKAIKDWLKTLEIDADNFYIGKLDNKKEHAIGVYASKKALAPYIAIGGLQNTTFKSKPVTFLIHWNKNQDETEQASYRLYEALEEKTNIIIGGVNIKYLELLECGPIDVGTDDKGIYEMVINAVFYYERSI